LQLSLTDAQQRHLRDPSNETPKPGDPKLSNSHFHILASSQTALAAAEHHAKSHAEIARQHAQKGETVAILSGGELTVTKPRGDQAGGPNHEYALALAIELDGAPDIFAIACDTDGIDGRTDATGALIGPDTLQRARALGQDPIQTLNTHNSGDFFAALKANVVTGPTNTNVNDFRCLLLNPKALNRK
jgi:hydroxypyruvate reductase